MNNPCVVVDRESGRQQEKSISGTPGERAAFAALRVMPGGGSVPPYILEAVGQKIHGVAGLRLDAARGRIHVIYDGAASTLDQVESAVNALGLRTRHAADSALEITTVGLDPMAKLPISGAE